MITVMIGIKQRRGGEMSISDWMDFFDDCAEERGEIMSDLNCLNRLTQERRENVRFNLL